MTFSLKSDVMSSNQSGEGEIRKNIIEADLVDCMVALPGQLFYSTQIPACLWFLARDRRGGSPTRPMRDRRGQILFIDARKMGRMVDRTHRELTDEDIARIANTYHAWRTVGLGMPRPYRNIGTSLVFANLPPWTKSASTATCSRRAATSVPPNRKKTTNRSTRRCNGWWRNCARSKPKPPNSTPPSPPTSRSWASGR